MALHFSEQEFSRRREALSGAMKASVLMVCYYSVRKACTGSPDMTHLAMCFFNVWP